MDSFINLIQQTTMDKRIAQVLAGLKQLPIRALLLEFWRDPRRRVGLSAVTLAAYLLLQRSLRYRRLKRLQKIYRKYTTREEMASMTDHDAWKIQKEMLVMEFPSASLKALQFALFRVRTAYLCNIVSILTYPDLRHPNNIQPPAQNIPVFQPGYLL